MYVILQQVNWWGAAAWAIFIFAAFKRKSWTIPVGIFAGVMSMIGGYIMGIHNVTQVQRFSMFLPAPIVSTILLVVLCLPATQKFLKNWISSPQAADSSQIATSPALAGSD